jgi:hypothetical protein
VIKTQNQSMDAYCVSNGVRPLLSYGAKGTRVGRKTYIFTTALKNFESLHHLMDLSEAYKKARNTFAGKMEQVFVVLKEGVYSAMVTGANSDPIGDKTGEKRRAEDEMGNVNKK